MRYYGSLLLVGTGLNCFVHFARGAILMCYFTPYCLSFPDSCRILCEEQGYCEQNVVQRQEAFWSSRRAGLLAPAKRRPRRALLSRWRSPLQRQPMGLRAARPVLALQHHLLLRVAELEIHLRKKRGKRYCSAQLRCFKDMSPSMFMLANWRVSPCKSFAPSRLLRFRHWRKQVQRG